MSPPNGAPSFTLPTNLSSLALQRFDKIHSEGKLIYGPSTPEIVQHDGFTVSACPNPQTFF